jgi:hypothetical protein
MDWVGLTRTVSSSFSVRMIGENKNVNNLLTVSADTCALKNYEIVLVIDDTILLIISDLKMAKNNNKRKELKN